MKNHRQLKNNQFAMKLAHLIAKAEGSETDYGLTPDLIVSAKATLAAMQANAAEKARLKAAQKSLTTKTKDDRDRGNDLIALMKTTSASKKIPNTKLAEIEFGGKDTIKSKIRVYAPLDLIVTGFSNGTNQTKWNGSDNQQGTIYHVEALIGAATDFAIIGITTRKKFEHKNQKPGVKTIYRIRAQRGDNFSDYSNEATVY